MEWSGGEKWSEKRETYDDQVFFSLLLGNVSPCKSKRLGGDLCTCAEEVNGLGIFQGVCADQKGMSENECVLCESIRG